MRLSATQNVPTTTDSPAPFDFNMTAQDEQNLHKAASVASLARLALMVWLVFGKK